MLYNQYTIDEKKEYLNNKNMFNVIGFFNEIIHNIIKQ